ncbi:MAG TPA: glycosyltransferase family 2 protein, partial [Vicinamibacterales bacterium]|nr:glycosyltransferase family 2 protein [Vicinamibacterales bacterium]
GLALGSRPHVVFLDADDRLTPNALRDGLEALAGRPEAACAIGLCCIIGPDGRPQPYRQQGPVEGDPYEALLRENFVWMPAQAIYRREALTRSGGFDPSIPAAADYDLYLRLARQFPVALHRAIVAEYRMHGQNMSGNPVLMLQSTLAVLERQWPHARRTAAHRAAYAAGNRFWRQFYGDRIVEQIREQLRVEGWGRRVAFTAMRLFRYNPRAVFLHLSRKVRNKVMSARTDA